MTQTVVSVQAFAVRVSLRTEWTFVTVEDEFGRRGFGESVVPEDRSGLDAHISRAGAGLRGLEMSEALLQLGSPGDATRAGVRARAALSQALRDLRARGEDQSLARALGSPARDLIKCYANLNRGLNDRSPAAFADRASQAAAAGFEAVKIAPFDGLSPAIVGTEGGRALLEVAYRRIGAVRDAIGPSKGLYVDCHWRFDERTAYEAIDQAARSGVSWFECPLPERPDMFAALRRLRAHAARRGMRLAGGDECESYAALMEMRRGGIYDVLMPDVAYLGVDDTLAAARAILASGVDCSLHNPRGPIAHAHSVQLSALLPTTTPLEFPFGETPLFTELVLGTHTRPVGGAVTLTASPGIGAAINHVLAAQIGRRQSALEATPTPAAQARLSKEE